MGRQRDRRFDDRFFAGGVGNDAVRRLSLPPRRAIRRNCQSPCHACRLGLEAYQKMDRGSLPSLKNYYYANRRLFHHGNTKQGRYLQDLGRPAITTIHDEFTCCNMLRGTVHAYLNCPVPALKMKLHLLVDKAASKKSNSMLFVLSHRIIIHPFVISWLGAHARRRGTPALR